LGIEVGKPRRGAVWRNHGSTCRWLSGFPVLVEAFVDAEGVIRRMRGRGIGGKERKKEKSTGLKTRHYKNKPEAAGAVG
jgi:hypothetical protein